MARNISRMSRSPAPKTINVAWSPPPPPRKKKKEEKNSIQKAVDRHKQLEDLINEM